MNLLPHGRRGTLAAHRTPTGRSRQEMHRLNPICVLVEAAAYIIRRMRRFLILLFVLLLPLQFAWAGAAAYCSHDSQHDGANAVAKWHFGHHSHAHRANIADAADTTKTADHGSPDGKDGSGKVKLPDLDCAVCHFAGAQLVLPDFAGPGPHFGVAISYRSLAPSFLSAPGATPDRPQWSLA
ncbi:cation efflux protein, CzcI family [Cupriavidus sp. 30B13]|uniref:cation efflux protein, CzcI family n=1 Tax=Cupriavidus sp. 30B13 TaxID=3384241 RepID=UPI003B919CAC